VAAELRERGAGGAARAEAIAETCWPGATDSRADHFARRHPQRADSITYQKGAT
jgi:hypothetical protein